MVKERMERLNKWFGVLLIMVLILMAGCGGTNPEKVKKKVMEKWTEQDGYEIKAQMSEQSANENAQYDIDVWHTKPDYYRVSVSEEDPEKTQLIVRISLQWEDNGIQYFLASTILT